MKRSSKEKLVSVLRTLAELNVTQMPPILYINFKPSRNKYVKQVQISKISVRLWLSLREIVSVGQMESHLRKSFREGPRV